MHGFVVTDDQPPTNPVAMFDRNMRLPHPTDGPLLVPLTTDEQRPDEQQQPDQGGPTRRFFLVVEPVSQSLRRLIGDGVARMVPRGLSASGVLVDPYIEPTYPAVQARAKGRKVTKRPMIRDMGREPLA